MSDTNTKDAEIANLAAEIAELKAKLEHYGSVAEWMGKPTSDLHTELIRLRAELEAVNQKVRDADFERIGAVNALKRNSESFEAMKAELEAARKELKSPRFHVPDGLLDNFRRYIPELPPCEIVEDGVMVGKDALIELVNRLKNGMADDLDTALAAKDAAEKALQADLIVFDALARIFKSEAAMVRAKHLRNFLTPAPTQEPPACKTCNGTGWLKAVDGHTECPFCTPPKAPAGGVTISTEKKGEQHARPETLAEETPLTNSPADAPSEGRGEYHKPGCAAVHGIAADGTEILTGMVCTCSFMLPTEGSGA